MKAETFVEVVMVGFLVAGIFAMTGLGAMIWKQVLS